MNRLERLFFSTKTMTVLLFIFAGSMAIGTFIENDYDTATAKILIYNAKWFEILIIWLIIIFIFNIKTYQLTKKEKWPILVFHLSFILMFLGGAITRYWGFEGQMPIQEGETSNEVISDLTFIKVSINDGLKTITYDQDPYTMSYFNENSFRWPFRRTFNHNYRFDSKVINIKSLDFIPMAKDSLQESASGRRFLRIITTEHGERMYNYIAAGEIKTIGGILFSFNNPVRGTVQLIEHGDSLMINSPIVMKYSSIRGQQPGVISDSSLLVQQSGLIEANELRLVDLRTLYTIKENTFIIPGASLTGKIIYYSGDKGKMMDRNLLSVVKMQITSGKDRDTVMVEGGKGITAYSTKVNINKLKIAIGYGSKLVNTPFAIRCNDFKIDRYPGSDNASSYESSVTVIDNGKERPQHIYMNNVMDYKGYRFYQASYFPDESGTILSVNQDRWGTRITYMGYFFLFLGMFTTLFRKHTHFWKINQRLKAVKKNAIVVIPLLLTFSFSNAQDSLQHKMASSYYEKEGELFSKPGELGGKLVDANHADRFGRLLVQDFQGRIKPMNTLALELLRKIYKKDKFESFSPVQWYLSMQLDPAYWFGQPIIYVGKKGGDELAKETGANAEGYTTFSNLMDVTGAFKLQSQYKNSFRKRKAEQSNYDKELINLTERYSIYGNIIYGYFTRIIPIKNDPSNTWRSWIYSSDYNPASLDSVAYAFIALYFDDVKRSLHTGNWKNANETLTKISNFQKKWGKDIILSDSKVNLEILYNRANIFFWLMIVYSFLGVSMIILGFAGVLSYGAKIDYSVRILTRIFLGIMILSLIVQIMGLGVRWYLSGHAPWSNGYEAIIFISSIGVLAGLLLYKNRNAFIPAAGALVAMIMMGFAHGGSMLDPEITPLEPVLKSYWLMVHVGIITSSYGFFALSALISVFALTMFCLKPTGKIQIAIQELTIVNEMAAEIGLFALAVGTFLGAIWANESWGRYWSWDPKETWAFISIIFYAAILHFRMVPGLKGKWTFNLAGMWIIWTVIFTYFGVNYYLSGLHSYAAGDPMPIPAWIPVTVVVMLVLSVTSYFRKSKIGSSQ